MTEHTEKLFYYKREIEIIWENRIFNLVEIKFKDTGKTVICDRAAILLKPAEEYYISTTYFERRNI